MYFYYYYLLGLYVKINLFLSIKKLRSLLISECFYEVKYFFRLKVICFGLLNEILETCVAQTSSSRPQVTFETSADRPPTCTKSYFVCYLLKVVIIFFKSLQHNKKKIQIRHTYCVSLFILIPFCNVWLGRTACLNSDLHRV